MRRQVDNVRADTKQASTEAHFNRAESTAAAAAAAAAGVTVHLLQFVPASKCAVHTTLLTRQAGFAFHLDS
jgi:hypothetical protein